MITVHATVLLFLTFSSASWMVPHGVTKAELSLPPALPSWVLNAPVNFRRNYQLSLAKNASYRQDMSFSMMKDFRGDNQTIKTLKAITNREYELAKNATDYENVDALEHFFWGMKHGLAVELGALDGSDTTDSVSGTFERHLGWKRILVEADPTYRDALKSASPDAFSVNAAVCKNDTMTQPLHFMSRQFIGGIAETMNLAFIRQHWPELVLASSASAVVVTEGNHLPSLPVRNTSLTTSNGSSSNSASSRIVPITVSLKNDTTWTFGFPAEWHLSLVDWASPAIKDFVKTINCVSLGEVFSVARGVFYSKDGSMLQGVVSSTPSNSSHTDQNKSSLAVPAAGSVTKPSPLISPLVHPLHINFFVLDVEGAETTVLETIDWSAVIIDVICVETMGRDRKSIFHLKQILSFHKFVQLSPDRGRNTWFIRRGFEPSRRPGLSDQCWSGANKVHYRRKIREGGRCQLSGGETYN